MKTILTRLQTIIQTNSTLSYIKKTEIVSPKLLPDISQTMVPYIGLAPISTSESWIAQRKEAINNVDLYIVNFLQQQENAIIGNTTKKGLLEIVEDVESVIRGHRLPDGSGNYYLSKPIEITNVDYVVSGYGDNVYLLVASLFLNCTRIFNITLP